MKKIVLILLAAVMVAGFSGCSSKDRDIDVTGSWRFSLDWARSADITVPVDIYSNGTLTISGSTGSWTRDGNNITIYFGIATFRGTTTNAGDFMSGSMNNTEGNSGVWSGILLSRSIRTAAEVPGDQAARAAAGQ